MARIDALLDVVQSIAEALERGDDGDIDSPPWENQRRLERLQAQLIAMVRAMGNDQADELAMIRIEPEFEPIPA